MKMRPPFKPACSTMDYRFADQPLALRTRLTGMATTLMVCAALAAISMWQTSTPLPPRSEAPGLAVMNITPLDAPPTVRTEKTSREPTDTEEAQENVTKPAQQQADPTAAALPTFPIQRLAVAPAVTLDVGSAAVPSTSVSAAKDQLAAIRTTTSESHEASAALASEDPPAHMASPEKDRWESQVLAALNRVKHYPREATRLRQEGISWICITMDRRGKVRGVRLHKGSGYLVLDQEALAMASRADPLPRPPSTTNMLRVEVTVPIAFRMRDT